MTPPVVMHVIPGLGIGGAERMLTSLITARRKERFPQCVVNLTADGEFSDQIRDSGVPVYEIALSQSNLPAAVLRLASLIRRMSPRAIQGWLYYGDLIATAALYLSGKRHRTRLYWGVRCSDITQSSYGMPLRLSLAACAKLSRFPDAVIANSYIGRRDHQRLGYRPHAFPVIPNGIDIARFQPDSAARARVRAELNIRDESPLVLHVARVDPMKDHATFLKVATAMSDIRFAAIGSGTEKLDGPPNVMRLGIRRDMAAVYAAADFLISTSTFGEGFSNVIAEGLASGVPAVATDVGDAREIIGDTGSIVDPGCAPALVSALRRLLDEPEDQRRGRAKSCRERIITRFSLERAVARFDEIHRGAEDSPSATIGGGVIGAL